MKDGNVELSDLVGLHKLSGVDRETVKGGGYYSDEDCEIFIFRLDRKTYVAQEDPEDGYRSCMDSIKTSSDTIKNRFPSQAVFCKMREKSHGEDNDVLEMYDVQTGKLVLAVGTGNTDDYYPYWVAEFYPENMFCNRIAEGTPQDHGTDQGDNR